MIKCSLMLNYGVVVTDLSTKGKTSKVVLMYDFESALRLNVFTRTGLRKYTLNIRDLNSTFFCCSKQDLTITISLIKGSFVYKFASELELENVYNCILGDNYLHFGLLNEQKNQQNEVDRLKQEISGWASTIQQLTTSFLLICKFQLSIGNELQIAPTISKLHFESLIKSYFKTQDMESFDRFLKLSGFADKHVYDQKDLLSFLLHEELDCESTESLFRSEVF